jgi:mRNA interferase HicA
VKRIDLLRRLRKGAKAAGATFDLVREGASHSIYVYGAQQVVIPRHNEINEYTARGILDDVGLQ